MRASSPRSSRSCIGAIARAAGDDQASRISSGAASRLPPLSIRRPVHSLRLLFSNLRWLAGFAAGLAGWALYVAALALAPLSLVQAASAGGIGLLALLVRRAAAVPLERRERAGVGAAIAGLALLGISLAGHAQDGHQAPAGVVILWIVVSLAAAALASARLPGGAGFGLAAGVLYAAGDVATKAAVGGGAAVAFVVAVLACHGLAFVALQLGFQRGGALSTAGVSTLLTNALPILAGMLVFDEGIPPGLLGALRVLAFAGVVVGAALLCVPAEAGRAAAPRSRARSAGLRPLTRARTID